MANLSFSNRSFQRTVKRIRNIMPYLAVSLLILVYVVSAIAEGKFLAASMGTVAGGAWLAYLISLSTQATRALLVFFPQLNPNRPTFGYTGEVIAVIMGLIAIASIIGLVHHAGLSTPVAISLSILMLAGIGVEIFFLREIRYATELEIFEKKEHWEELQNYHQSRAQFSAFLDNIKDFEINGQQPLPSPTSASPTPLPQPQEKSIVWSKKLLSAMASAPNLSEEQTQKIMMWMEQRKSEDFIIEEIKKMALPLDLSLNGNGHH